MAPISDEGEMSRLPGLQADNRRPVEVKGVLSFGLRGLDIEPARSADVLRVLLTSVRATLGRLVDLEATFSP